MTDIKEPREGYLTVAGIPWLARMIDKARLDAGGEIERFDLEYPCPMDKSLLEQFGLSSKEFQKIAVAKKSDMEIVEELKKRNVIIT